MLAKWGESECFNTLEFDAEKPPLNSIDPEGDIDHFVHLVMCSTPANEPIRQFSSRFGPINRHARIIAGVGTVHTITVSGQSRWL